MKNKYWLFNIKKYILCCIALACILVISGCSARDSFAPDDESEGSRPSANQSSDVSPESDVTSGPDTVQNSNADQNRDIGETSVTVRELLDLITPLHTADAIEKYFDQYYTIVGAINDIGVDGDRGTIILEGPSLNGMSAATLFFDPPPDGFDNLQKGQVIKVKGYLDGSLYELMVHLYFLECELIEVGPPSAEQQNEQEHPATGIGTSQNDDTNNGYVAEESNSSVENSDEFYPEQHAPYTLDDYLEDGYISYWGIDTASWPYGFYFNSLGYGMDLSHGFDDGREVDILSFYDPDGSYMFTIYRYEGFVGFRADSDQIYLYTTGERQVEEGQVEIGAYISSYAGFDIPPLKGIYFCVEVYQDLQ